MDKFSNLRDKLQKAATGEGSRGGKIIGHTKSGKPIYASSQHESHQEFGSGEHRDAMNHHYDIWTKTNEKIAQIRQNNPNWNPPKQIHDFLKHHYTQMQMHQSRMGQAENKEKQRGVVGAGQAPKQEQGKKFEPLRYGHMSKSQEITPFYAAVIVVDSKQKSFLLGKRKEDKLWTSPAGGAKVGEMPKAVAIREAFEEANLVLTEEQLIELPMGYAHNFRPVHCFIVILSDEQAKTISVVNDPDKEVNEWKWFPIDEKLPEPMDDNRFTTMTNAKMHLAGIVMKSYYNMDDMEGMTSVNLTEQATGNSYDTRLKDYLEKLMADYKPGDEPVRIQVSDNHVLHLVRIDDGVYSGLVKKNEKDSSEAEVENVLNIDKMTMSDLVELMKLKGIEPVRTLSSEEVGRAYAEGMDRAAEALAEQERQADARMAMFRKFPEPQNRTEEDRISKLVDALMGMTVNGDVNIIIQKAKSLPVGTVRQWGPYKYVKHNDGWVVIGGEHHGKLMGDFKSDSKYGDYARHHEKSSAKPEEPKKEPTPKKEDVESAGTPEPKAEAPKSEDKPKEEPKQEGTPYERAFQKFMGMAPEERMALMQKVGKNKDTAAWQKAAIEALAKQEAISSDEKQEPNLGTEKPKEGIEEKQNPPVIEGLNPEINNRTNMVKAVDLGRNNKALQKQFMTYLDDCNKLVDSMGIQFKTPMTFKGTALAKLGKRVRGTYMDGSKTIELKDMSAANKTIMHEIGHALDYSMSEVIRGNRGRHSDMLRDSGNELYSTYKSLHEVVVGSEFYQTASPKYKKYLVTPTEVFARAFEVYSYKKAEDMNMPKEFMDTFMPDVFKMKDPELEKLRKELDDQSNKLVKQSYDPKVSSDSPEFKELREKVQSLREKFNKEREKTTDGWTYVPDDKQKEYKDKVTTLMEKILKDDKIRKALDESDLAITLQKSEAFQKSGLPVGTVRLWGGKKFIKHGDGHWAPMPDAQAGAAQQPAQPQAAAETPAPQAPAKEEPQEEEIEMGPLDHLKPEKNAGGHITIHSKDFAEALKNGPISIISAGVNPNNPEDRALTDSQVSERYKRLEQDLKDHGYKYTKVKGHYGGEEDSFIVFHADENHMNELGEKYNQDSVIHATGGKNKLHFTTGDNKGKHHKGDGHEEVPDAKDYYSVVSTSDGQKKKFSLGLDFGKLHDAEEKKQAQ